MIKKKIHSKHQLKKQPFSTMKKNKFNENFSNFIHVNKMNEKKEKKAYRRRYNKSLINPHFHYVTISTRPFFIYNIYTFVSFSLSHSFCSFFSCVNRFVMNFLFDSFVLKFVFFLFEDFSIISTKFDGHLFPHQNQFHCCLSAFFSVWLMQELVLSRS